MTAAAKGPPPQLLVVSLLAGEEVCRTKAVELLAASFGPLIYLSRVLAFPGQGYYTPEMGPGLTRRLAAFRELTTPGRLGAHKRLTREMEHELAREGRRQVNLDPGLLGPGGFILATTKWRGHRLPLEPGLYSELTLYFHHGGFQPLPWTYEDYAGAELRKLLGDLRRAYLALLRESRSQGREIC
ncbi:MAG: DUF4416 family protein [Deltaproteobacteria bacterium]|nr:DUF4416 family protein [Deltaproteobacteria bacterium]